LVQTELIEDLDEALAEWQEGYEMTPEQVAFVRSLFSRKAAQPDATIELSPTDVEMLTTVSKEPSEEGLSACREKLAAIGIRLP
jgi:hypothetical protein